MKKCLDDICTIHTGVLFKKKIDPVSDGDVAVIQLASVEQNKKIDKEKLIKIKFDKQFKRHLLKKGDILFKAKSTDHSAVVFDEEFRALATHHFFILRIDENVDILPEYLSLFINLVSSQQYFDSNTANTHIIKKKTLSSLEVYIPDAEIQKKAVSIQKNIMEQIKNHWDIIERKKEILSLYLGSLTEG